MSYFRDLVNVCVKVEKGCKDKDLTPGELKVKKDVTWFDSVEKKKKKINKKITKA